MQTFNFDNIRFAYIIIYTKEGELVMMKFLSKMAEKYAKATNTASLIIWWSHQPKMPASLIKKD